VVSARENSIRIESRASLEFPIDLAGIDNMGLFFLFGAFASFAF
jgi:hypothetical protein